MHPRDKNASLKSNRKQPPGTLFNYFKKISTENTIDLPIRSTNYVDLTLDLDSDDGDESYIENQLKHATNNALRRSNSSIKTSPASSQTSTSSQNNVLSFSQFGSNRQEIKNQQKYNLWNPHQKTPTSFSSQETQITASPSPPESQKRLPVRSVEPEYKRQSTDTSYSLTTNKRPRTLPSTFASSSSALKLSTNSWGQSIKESKKDYYQYSNPNTFTKSYPYSASTKSNNRMRKKPIREAEYAPPLSEEQQKIINMVIKDGESLFFTGSAGTGKSVLLRALIDKLQEIHGEGVAVTASTGIAACNINGSTLHSFGGIGLGKEAPHILFANIRGKSKVLERWRSTKVLIIDEISMIDGDLFDKIEALGRLTRDREDPFGGMQIIATGDFFQLPPVNTSGAKFAFESAAWTKAIKKTVMLTHVFRQKDQHFIDILNEMRLGILSKEAIATFRSLSREPVNRTNIEPTELFPLRNQVDQSNERRLQALAGSIYEYYSDDTGDRNKLVACIAPNTIKLKMNAQVMLLKNMDSTLVNGSLGIVIGFAGEGQFSKADRIMSCFAPNKIMSENISIDEIKAQKCPIVRFSDNRDILIEKDRWSFELPGGKEIAARSQLPLMLAWAMSIHKSQGQTLERVRVDLGRVFEKGQAYVALSRATSLDALQILNFEPSKVMAHPKVTEFYRTLKTI